MVKKHTSDSAFIEALKNKSSGDITAVNTFHPPRMILNTPPVRSTVSTDDLYEQELARAASNSRISQLQDPPNSEGPSSAPKARVIPLSLIDDSPFQPRLIYDPVEIDNLAHMLVAAGQDERITVRLMPSGRYQLIKGHRRTRAARTLGWQDIEANVVELDDRAAELSAMISNEGQIGLSDYERGKVYKRAKAKGFAKTQEDVANLFGTVQGLVSMRMSMLDLPEPFINMLERNPRMFGATTASDIRKLLKEYPTQEKLIEKAALRINDGASENSVKAWVQQMLKPKTISNEAVVTDKSGKLIFKTKYSGRDFTIQIKDADLSPADIEELLLTALRECANKKEDLN